jgi:hypothetical protein
MPETESGGCPNCGGALAPGAEACPNCPWSLHNESAAESRSRVSLQIPGPVAAILLFIAIGFIGYRILDAFILEQQNTEAALHPTPVKHDDRVVMDTSAIKLKPGASWKVHGRIYHLLSLEPAAGARVSFRNRKDGSFVRAQADSRGLYHAALPKKAEEGYDVAVEARGAGGFIEEMSPPYRGQDRQRRLDALSGARRASLLHVPLTPDVIEDQVTWDLVVLPR